MYTRTCNLLAYLPALGYIDVYTLCMLMTPLKPTLPLFAFDRKLQMNIYTFVLLVFCTCSLDLLTVRKLKQGNHIVAS